MQAAVKLLWAGAGGTDAMEPFDQIIFAQQDNTDTWRPVYRERQSGDFTFDVNNGLVIYAANSGIVDWLNSTGATRTIDRLAVLLHSAQSMSFGQGEFPVFLFDSPISPAYAVPDGITLRHSAMSATFPKGVVRIMAIAIGGVTNIWEAHHVLTIDNNPTGLYGVGFGVGDPLFEMDGSDESLLTVRYIGGDGTDNGTLEYVNETESAQVISSYHMQLSEDGVPTDIYIIPPVSFGPVTLQPGQRLILENIKLRIDQEA